MAFLSRFLVHKIEHIPYLIPKFTKFDFHNNLLLILIKIKYLTKRHSKTADYIFFLLLRIIY